LTLQLTAGDNVPLVTDAPVVPLGRAWELAERLAALIKDISPTEDRIEPTGDLRRGTLTVASVALVVLSDTPSLVMEAIASSGQLVISEATPETITGTYSRAGVDLHFATPANYGTVLFNTTGPEAHLRQMSARGLRRRDFPTEDDLYGSVGLTCIPPELREGTGEIEAAASGTIPRLVDSGNIRGDLHMHSTFSDGRDSCETMAEGCAALGYEYIAFTDHSWRAAAASTLSYDDIARQREEIDHLRDRFPRMTILHGVEVDIRADGDLDFEDETLEQFDIVLASLHERLNHDGARLTQRSLSAISHPLVNVLCHPANHLPGRSLGYPLDFEAIYAAAAETGTALEIDGSPSHLDLDADRARAAVSAGATITIDSDCHKVEALGRQMGLGVRLARRAGIEARHVLTCRPLSEVRAFVAAKRAGRRP
jgi:DNA polymerase (family 10)